MTLDPDTKIGGPDAAYRKKDKAPKRNKEVVVQLAREFDGSIYSRVVDKANINHWSGEPYELVIDRKTRILDARVIKRRAEVLAEMLGVPFEEDLRWPCQAPRKMACRCPKCVEEGRA